MDIKLRSCKSKKGFSFPHSLVSHNEKTLIIPSDYSSESGLVSRQKYNWHAVNGELEGIPDSEHWYWIVKISLNIPGKTKEMCKLSIYPKFL